MLFSQKSFFGANACRGSVRSTLVVIVAIAVIAVGLFLGLKEPPDEEIAQRASGPAPVLVEPVSLDTITETLEALGTVQANEIVTLSSKVTERIESIHFTDGELVDAGDLLFQLRDSEQRAELAEAKAQLSERERQLERVRSVGDSGAVSKSALDEELTRFDSAKARYDLIEARIEDRRILAPFHGQLGLRGVSPGELVSSGTQLITLSDLTPVKLDFTAPERFVGRLAAGQSIHSTSVAYPDSVFEGKIQTVSPTVDPVTRAAQARAIIPNDDQKLRPGMLLKVSISLGQRESLSVPESALAPVGNQQFVIIVDAEGVAQRRAVSVGRRVQGRVEIVEGVSEGERVITHGYRATPGQKVNVTEESAVFTKGREKS